MSEYHEPAEALTEEAKNLHRALTSLKEEVESVDWYHQRVVACTDPELQRLLAHNRDEEIEHACMALEWLRRNMAGWDEQLRTYLFTEANITNVEESTEGGSQGVERRAGDAQRTLGIGSLKGK